MGKSKSMPEFSLIDKKAKLGKIINNVEDEVPEFKIPVEVLLNADEMAALFGDKNFVAGLFVKNGSGIDIGRMAGMSKDFKLTVMYDSATVIMTLVDGKDVDFEGCILDSFGYMPLPGGQIGLSFHLYLEPGIGKANLQLQEHQNHEVDLTITNATLALKAKSKQGELALGDPDSEYAGNDPDPPPRDERAEPKARKSRKRGPVAEATH